MSRISVAFNHMAATFEQSITENQRLTRQLLNAQENERSSLARELHDEIGQCVSAIHADAVAVRNRGGETVRESAEAIVQVAGHIKDIVRSMLRRLRPAYLEGLALEAALCEQVAGFRQRNPELADLNGEVGIAIYRLVQESLTNIAVHANARNAIIEVTASDNEPNHRQVRGVPTVGSVRITVADDGAGFFLMSANQGFGLTGIRERVKAFGGSCSIDTHPGRGTRISVLLPRIPAPESHT
jgi:two-component system sensor histidine kinase UhpB